jgi:hypothetical protein
MLLLWLLYCGTCIILKQIWLLLWYCCICTIPQQCGCCGCCIAVLAQYFNKCCYYGHCILVLHITFMEVTTVVAGTAAVPALHGTHAIKSLGFFFPPPIRPMRGDCKLTGTLCLMYYHIIFLTTCITLHSGRFTDASHHSTVTQFAKS